MYDTDGDFGRVRLTMRPRYPFYEKYFNCITICGWHCCNDKYRITRSANDSDTNLILYTVSGQGELVMNGTVFSLLPETAVLIKSNTPVSYYTPKNGLWEFYWIHFTGAPCREQIDLISRQAKQLVTYPNESIRRITEYVLSDKNRDSVDTIIKISDLLSQMIHEFLLNQDIADAEKNVYSAVAGNVISYIRNHYSEDMTIEDVSRQIYISCEHLIRSFRKETGITPYAYLCRFRVERAKDLLNNTNISIEKIAHMVGFKSHSNFSKQFRVIEGATPYKFRSNQKSAEGPEATR